MTNGSHGAVTWSCARDGVAVRLRGEIDGSNKSSAPAANPSTAACGAARADNTITASAAMAGSARNAASSPNPSSRGIVEHMRQETGARRYPPLACGALY